MRSSAPPERHSRRSLLRAARPVVSLERYTVEAELASGGVGTVYRVVDRATGESRALKRLRPAALDDPLTVEAFEREYQVLAGILHPRIIRVHDYGVDARGPYYTMELLEGDDVGKAAPLDVREACGYLRDVATSLSLLHARRLVHRDLSPTNVRKTPDGHCKLLDFGALAEFGPSRHVVGTAPAVPREAIDGSPLDGRSDLYSLGALGYFLLTGRHAYPAARFEDLLELWQHAPIPPSAFAPEVPRELDALILGMLSRDPLARPASAVEVIARLGALGLLDADADDPPEAFAERLLSRPAFIGRTSELEDVRTRAQAAVLGRGGAVRIEATLGTGRTRFLVEAGVRAQVCGATVVTVDATMHQGALGTARALVLRLFDALPDVAADAASRHTDALRGLGREISQRMGTRGSLAAAPGDESAVGLDEWFCDVARAKPLVVIVDDVEQADPHSLAVLTTLAKVAPEHPLLVLVAEGLRDGKERPDALRALATASIPIALDGLDAGETRALVHSLFGDAPGLERFAPWLHEWTAGNPLHAFEVARKLVRDGVIRYVDGVWVLPIDRPRAQIPAKLEGALSLRVALLGERARGLAECLCLGRKPATVALCRAVLPDADERDVLTLVDELVRNEILDAGLDGHRFTSMAVRNAVLAGLDDLRLEAAHLRLGEAFARLSNDTDVALSIEAGFHLIEGGDDLRGADRIAAATTDSVAVRTLNANLHHLGKPIEAALLVYKRHRRSIYERMPLLAALAQAGFYEARVWGERYGDEALDALEEISGLRVANRARRFLGRTLGLVFGVLVALVRFHLTPRSERRYSFAQLMVQLFATVTTLAGNAAQSFDAERGERVADVLVPFSGLPARLTPVGIHAYCRALASVAREHEAETSRTFETLLARFANPRYYPTLPAEARRLYVAAAHFARGSLAVMRADGRSALACADGLDATGLALYAMIASQLRYLYHMNRGEHTLAAPHRERVERHAAHTGSAWQVEAWEASALVPVSIATSDVVTLTRITDRLEELSRTLPSLKLHSRLARLALVLEQENSTTSATRAALGELEKRPARGFIGWAAAYGFVARSYNEAGEHEKARALCEQVLASMTDDDREYVTLFLIVDIEMAMAEAGLGQTDAAFARIDRLLARFESTGHPWVLGRLHETRARIAWQLGDRAGYEDSRRAMEARYRPTGTPILIARCQRVAELALPTSMVRASLAPVASTERDAMMTMRADVSGPRSA